MPSSAFIKAASAANRQPVVLLAIESVDAIKRQITTQPDWLAASPVNLNTATEPGRVFLTTDGTEPYAGFYPAGTVTAAAGSPPVTVGAPYGTVSWWGPLGEELWGGYAVSGESPVVTTPGRTVSVTLHYSGSVYLHDPLFPEENRGFIGNLLADVYGRCDGGAWQSLASVTLDGHNQSNMRPQYTCGVAQTIQFDGLARGVWEIKLVMTSFKILYPYYGMLLPEQAAVTIDSIETTRETRYLASASLSSAPVDLGIIPSSPSRFEADDLIPSGASITYHGYGSDNGTAWIDLGTITDGASLAAYRYYYISAALTCGGIYTPVIDELRIIGGNSQFDYISTHKDIPIQGALPYIAPGGISSITSKIDLSDQATVGELSIKMFWRKKTGDMLATGYLKNKNIICKIGFTGLSEQDFEPYFTGTWYDYQADHEKMIISVKTRDVLKRFNRKVPAATFFIDNTGVAYNPPRLYDLSGNIMAVMLQIADLLGIPDRFLDKASFNALGAGARSGADWNVSRKLKEPMAADGLMNELAISAGVFLVQMPDGRLTAKLFDQFLTDPPAATLDALVHKFKTIEGGQKELFTRQAIYYQLLAGADGGSASDYGKGHIYVNALAETNWNESATKEWMDKWGLSVNAIQLLALRRDSWFANPRNTVKVEGVPPRFWNLERGQVVAVDNLRLPCPADEWQGYTSGARYLVLGKTISDPTSTDLSFSYDLLSLADATFTTDPDFPTYTTLDFWPLVTGLALAERMIVLPGGSIQTMLDVSYNMPADFHLGGVQIWTRTNGGPWTFQLPVGAGGPSLQRITPLPVAEGTTVEVAVLTINAAGLVMALDAAPKASHYVAEKSLSTPLGSWTLNGQSIVTLTDGKVGTKALRLEGHAGGYPHATAYFPVDRTKTYRTRFWARPSSDNAAGLLYFCLQQFMDDAGTTGPINGGRAPYKPDAITRAAHNSVYGVDQWGEYSHTWTAADWQDGVKFVRPEFLDNYSDQTGHWDIQAFTFEEVTDVLAAAMTALWTGVTGSGKPADNATVGANYGNLAANSATDIQYTMAGTFGSAVSNTFTATTTSIVQSLSTTVYDGAFSMIFLVGIIELDCTSAIGAELVLIRNLDINDIVARQPLTSASKGIYILRVPYVAGTTAISIGLRTVSGTILYGATLAGMEIFRR